MDPSSLEQIDWFQLAALSAYLLAVVVRAAQLRLRYGINAITMGAGRPWRELLIEIGFVLFGIVWIIEVARHALGGSWTWWPRPMDEVLFESPLADLIGRVLVVLALALFIAALVSFGRSWRIGIDHDKPGELVTRGIFAFTRNPIFLSLDLLFLGFFLINPTRVMLILFLGMAAGAHMQILNEERFLLTQYGQSYEDYRKRTRRYF